MKKNKLKIITLILLIVLITMIGFFGIYAKDKTMVEDMVKDYQYAMDINGKRVVTLELDTSTTEEIKDKDGNIIESATEEEIAQNGYTKEEKKINIEESITEENFKLVKEIIEKRLNKLNVPSYAVRLDEEKGKMVVELPEGDNTDNWINNLATVGKLEIIDTNTKEVLLDNSNIETCEVLSNSTNSGTQILFSIVFNDEGKKKLEDITKTYVPAEENTESTSTSNDSTDNSTESTDESTEKTITMQIDGSDVMQTSFDEPITDGKMYLTVGQASTDSDTLNDNLQQARNMVAILSNKNLPLTYNIDGNIYVAGTIKDTFTNTMTSCVILVLLVSAIILIVKYKSKGLLATIAHIGLAALLLIIIRYWNVVLSIQGFAALIFVLILNFILLDKMLKNISEEENKKVELKHVINMKMKDFTLKIIPLFIMVVTFVFMQWSSTSSFGMVMFWGLTLIELYNLVITKNLLKYKKM